MRRITRRCTATEAAKKNSVNGMGRSVHKYLLYFFEEILKIVKPNPIFVGIYSEGT